jgi:hypothetical protein
LSWLFLNINSKKGKNKSAHPGAGLKMATPKCIGMPEIFVHLLLASYLLYPDYRKNQRQQIR